MTVTLAIATATSQVSVAIGGPDGPIGVVGLMQGRRHGETLAPAIEALTRLTGVGLDQVERIAVDTGPGLFTGLRVGVATAKALGAALDIPVAPCSSLDILAHPHRLAGCPVASVVDARRGEVFWAMYRPTPDGLLAVTEPAVATPEALIEAIASFGEPVLVTGDGARRYLACTDLAGAGIDLAPAEHDHPSASVLLEVAESRTFLAAEKVTPTYLRDADVRIGWEQV